MYQALYRKWRPQTFDEVVGQKHITETLKNQVKTGRLSHAYIFIGTRGTGKTTCAASWPGLSTVKTRWTATPAANAPPAGALPRVR